MAKDRNPVRQRRRRRIVRAMHGVPREVSRDRATTHVTIATFNGAT